jgi:hypothetical protein
MFDYYYLRFHPRDKNISIFLTFVEYKISKGELLAELVKDSALCIKCKGGKRLCGRDRCPYLEKMNMFNRSVPIEKDSFCGSSPPSVFVGRYGYPKVKMGPLLPPYRVFRPERLEDSSYWLDKEIEDIVGMRSSMYRTSQEISVKNSYEPSSRFLAASQELALSRKNVDTEVYLTSIPKVKKITSFDSRIAPMGPSVEARKIDITENPNVPKKVDYLTSDIHAKAVTAMVELYMSGIPVHHIVRILSSGLLGRAKARSLVPTRWSITAVDDAIGKELATKVRYFQQLNDVELYRYDHFGNYFYVLFIPGPYSYEMIETWLKGAFWSQDTVLVSDHEGFRGRKDYASYITGAYYAARLEALAYLSRLRRQATVIIYREITDKYWAPLGVWVIRDGVREALSSKVERFSGINEAISSITTQVQVKNWSNSSKLLKELRCQKRIEDYIDKIP